MCVSRVERIPFSVAEFGNTLTHDLAHRVPAALAFFEHRPLQAIAAAIDARSYPRAAVADILAREARAAHAPQAALENIERLRDPRTLVIATGQQTGFLGGPLYTLHKALTALAQAREYATRMNRPVVPVFWLAADDHDQGEIDHAYVLQSDGELRRLIAPLDPACAGCSACDLRLATGPALETLRQTLTETFDADAANDLLTLYGTHSFSQACVALFYRWLGETGLVIAPSDALRPLAGELLLHDLDSYATVSRLIQEAGLKLKTAGYEPGFSTSLRTAPHFFAAASEKRIRAALEPQENAFVERSPAFDAHALSPQRYERAALEDRIRTKPEGFSASAALRPVLQQTIFPVLSTVLGPGEIAYWAQLRAVHDHFGVPWPQVSVRCSATLLDPAGAKAQRKLGIESVPDLFLPESALRAKVLHGGETGHRLQTRAAALLRDFDALHADVRKAEGGLDPLFSKARERIAHELERVIEKTTAAIGQREDAGVNRLRYLSTLVRPRGQLQERVLSVGSFLFRFPNLAAELLPHVPAESTEHFVFTLD